MCNVQGVRLTAGTRPALACFRFAATASGSHRSASHAGGCRIGTEGEQHQRDTGTARRGEGVCLGVLREIRSTTLLSGIGNGLLAGAAPPEAVASTRFATLAGSLSEPAGSPTEEAPAPLTRHHRASGVGRPEKVKHLQAPRPIASPRLQQAALSGTRDDRIGQSSGSPQALVVVGATTHQSRWPVARCVANGCDLPAAKQATVAVPWRTRRQPARGVARSESVQKIQSSRPSRSPQDRHGATSRARAEGPAQACVAPVPQARSGSCFGRLGGAA